MQRRGVALEIAYLGTAFSGFARQPGRRTVEGVLRGALAAQGLDVPLAVAGRTDAGVHARRQWVTFRAREALDVVGLGVGLGAALAEVPDLWLRGAAAVGESFHARASARARTYVYRLRLGGPPSPFRWVLPPGACDWAAARAVLDAQLGTRDRSPFTYRPARAKVTTLHQASLEAGGSRARLVFRGDGFTRQLVRNWVAAAVAAARGTRPPETGARGFVGSPAPPEGLCLWEVDYGDDAPLVTPPH